MTALGCVLVGTLRLLHWSINQTLTVPLRTGALVSGVLGKLMTGGGLLLSSVFCGSKTRAAASTFFAQVCLIKVLFGSR